MQTIHLVVVGKLKESYWKEAEAEYLKRLQPFCNIILHELREESFTEKDPVDLIKGKEAEKILEKIDALKPSLVVALEEKGKIFSSVDFAKSFKAWHDAHHTIAIIIGGPLGIHQTIRDRAEKTVSLSPLTFTHQMTRVILLEQLYRAMMISGNRRYHY